MKQFLSEGKSRLAVILAFFTCGSLTATWVARIPTVQAKLALNEGGLGVVLLGLSIGVLVALPIAGGLIARYSSRKVALVGGLGMCVTLPVLALSPNPYILFTCLIVFGGMMSSMDVSMNEQAVLVERKAGHALMSSFHASYSIGGLFGSLISAGMASLKQVSLFTHFILASIFFAVVLVFMYPRLIPTGIVTSGKRVAFQFPQRALWALGAIAFCSSLNEIAMSDWSGVYLARVLKTDTAFAALGYAAFSLTMTIGRLLGDMLAGWFKPARIVRMGGLIATCGLAILIFTSHPLMAIAGFAIVGLGLSNVVPLAYGAAGNIPGIPPGTGIAGVANIAYIGSLVGPVLIGGIANASSLRVSFTMIAILAAMLVFLSVKVSPARKE